MTRTLAHTNKISIVRWRYTHRRQFTTKATNATNHHNDLLLLRQNIIIISVTEGAAMFITIYAIVWRQ